MICSSLQTYIFFFDFAASPRKYRKLKPVALRNEPKNHLFFPDPEHKQLCRAHHYCLHNFRVIVRRKHCPNSEHKQLRRAHHYCLHNFRVIVRYEHCPNSEHKQLCRAHHYCLHNFRVIVRREHSYNRELYIPYAYYHEKHSMIEHTLFIEHQSIHYSDLTHINKHTAVYIY